MNIKGQGHSLTKVTQIHIFKLFSLETARPIEAKFHVEPPWDWGMKVCSNGLGHKTNMVKTLKSLLLGIKHPMTLKAGMQHWVLEYMYYQICSNDEPGLTLTYLTAR